MPVIVRLISPEELQELAEGAKLRELRPRVAARILKEAFDQGGVLPFSTVGLLTGLHSPSAVSEAVALFYEQNPGVVLRHSGTIFDLGRTLTHKRLSVLLKHQGLLTRRSLVASTTIPAPWPATTTMMNGWVSYGKKANRLR